MIVRATSDHLNALVALENTLFSKDDFPLSRGSFSYHIKKNDLFVFMQDGQVTGYILWLKRKAYYRLYSLGVSEQCRGTGVAKALLMYSFKHVKAPYYSLEVKTTNQNAITLYEEFGFTKQKILADYYPKHHDGYLMKKPNKKELFD